MSYYPGIYLAGHQWPTVDALWFSACPHSTPIVPQKYAHIRYLINEKAEWAHYWLRWFEGTEHEVLESIGLNGFRARKL